MCGQKNKYPIFGVFTEKNDERVNMKVYYFTIYCWKNTFLKYQRKRKVQKLINKVTSY